MRKEPFLVKRIEKIKKTKTRVVIGLIGTHRGVGVTHVGIMLSQYISEELSGKTAFLECNKNNDFRYIQMAYEDIKEPNLKKMFMIYNVTYYMNVRVHELTELLNQDFEYIVLDLGSDFQVNKEEFLRSDIKFVIGSLIEWKRDRFMEFLESNQKLHRGEQWKYLVVFGLAKEIRQLKKRWNYNINSIPFEADPFILSKNSIKLFQKIW